MATYYIRQPDPDSAKARLIDDLVEAYALTGYPVYAIEIDDSATLLMLDPLFCAMADHVFRPQPELPAPETAAKVQPAGRKGAAKEKCPECGQIAAMTKKGYCKVCAMNKGRRNGHTVITDRNPNAIIAKRGAIGAHKLG